MSEDCGGINYALRLRGGTMEVHSKLPGGRAVLVQMSKLKSIQLFRKSVMPPAAIGGAGLLVSLMLRLIGDRFEALVSEELMKFCGLAGLAVAVVCLVILLIRWFFAELVMKPDGMSPIIVRMIPTGSARRFVMTAHSRALARQET